MAVVNPEIVAKMAQLNGLSDAILRVLNERRRTPEQALNLQSLNRQRQELRGTLPPLRLVHSREHA